MGEVTTFGELAREGRVILNDGYRTRTDELGKPGLPILRVAEVQDGFIAPSFGDHVHESFRPKFAAKTSAAGDIVITTKGTVGRVAMMREHHPVFVYSPQVCFFRCGAECGVLPEWLYYWFKGPEFASQALGVQSQTDMAPYINLADMRAVSVSVPPLTEQRAIAGVLGALDDKIESNRRQIRVLDDLFMTECSSLMIQAQVEGIHRLADLAEISLGGTPSRANPDFWIDGEIPWINSGCLHERPVLTPADFITELGCTKSATKVIPAGATVVAITGATLGVISRLGISCAINQSVVAISTREAVNDPYLHFWMRSNISDLVSSATGAAQQHVNKSNFEELRVEVPTRSVLDQVGAHGVLLDRQVSLAREAKTLILLRDTLLPELLFGRLRVRDAEKVVEGAL